MTEITVDDEFREDPYDEGAVATLAEDEPETTLLTPTGPCCEKCGCPNSGHEAVGCRQCGWYAGIGAHVEIDTNWEAATDPNFAPAESAAPR